MQAGTGVARAATVWQQQQRSPDRHGSQSRWPRRATRYNASTGALDPEGTTLNPPDTRLLRQRFRNYEATKNSQTKRGATHETRPDTTKHRARKGVLLSGVASTSRAWEIPEGSPRAICIASSTSQEEEHVKDPRKPWGLSDTCLREKETSSLFRQDVESNTRPYTRSAC